MRLLGLQRDSLYRACLYSKRVLLTFKGLIMVIFLFIELVQLNLILKSST